MFEISEIGHLRYQFNRFASAYHQCSVAVERRNGHRIIRSMLGPAIKIQKRLNGGITVSSNFNAAPYRFMRMHRTD